VTSKRTNRTEARSTVVKDGDPTRAKRTMVAAAAGLPAREVAGSGMKSHARNLAVKPHMRAAVGSPVRTLVGTADLAVNLLGVRAMA